MGNTLRARGAAQQDLLVVLQSELPDMLYQEQLSRGKFMKTLVCRRIPKDAFAGTHTHTHTAAAARGAAPDEAQALGEKVIVKIYLKRSDLVVDKAELARRIAQVRDQMSRLARAHTLLTHPNIVPYQRFEDSARQDCAFLMRQYFHSNLPERLNSRPFLTRVEKRWLMYQLLRALTHTHAAGLRHGDVKAENVMVTSWDWLFLVDFAPHKPTFIPADDPTEFDFFFSAESHTKCAVAPERFTSGAGGARAPVSGGTTAVAADAAAVAGADAAVGSAEASDGVFDASLSEGMDVFAAGCVLAELLLDGTPLFDLPSLLKYRSDSFYEPLRREEVREQLRDVDPTGVCTQLIEHMIQRNPVKRASAAAYLQACTARLDAAAGDVAVPALPLQPVFPVYFPYLYSFFAHLLRPEFQSADMRVVAVCAHYAELLEELADVCDPHGDLLFDHRLRLEAADAVAVAQFTLPRTRSTAHSRKRARRQRRVLCVDEDLRAVSLTTAYSVGQQVAAETSLALRWEWGWLESAAWGVGADDARQPAATAYRDVSSFHAPWRMLRRRDASTRSAVGVADAGTGRTSGQHRSEPVSRQQSAASHVSSVAQPLVGPQLTAQTSGTERLSVLLSSADACQAAVDASADVMDRPVTVTGNASSRDVSREDGEASEWVPVERDAVDTEGFTVLVVLLTSSLRTLSNPRVKLTALLLLSRFAAYVDDDVRLNRVVPYTMSQLTDPSPVIRAHVLCLVAACLSSVRAFSASDTGLFQQYVFPAFSRIAFSDPEPMVQVTAAECLSTLVTAAQQFIDVTQWRTQATAAARKAKSAGTSADGTSASPPVDPVVDASPRSQLHKVSREVDGGGLATTPRAKSTYDTDMSALHRRVQLLVQKWISGITTAATSLVNSASIENVAAGDGSARPSDTVSHADVELVHTRVLHRFAEALSQIPLSADTSLVRLALLRHSSQLCAFFGRAMTEEFFLPVMLTFITDPLASTSLTAMGPSLVPQLLPLASDDFRFLDDVMSPASTPSASAPAALSPSLMSVVLGWMSRSPIGTGDWLVRDAFLRQLVALARFLGPYNTQHRLLPFIEQPVHDVQEPLACRALVCLGALVFWRLIDSAQTTTLVEKHAALLLHPSAWVRRGVLRLVACALIRFGWPDAFRRLRAALNPLVHPARGDAMWQTVSATLSGATARRDWSKCSEAVSALELAVAAAAISSVSRATYDAEATRLALDVIGAASPVLQMRARAVAAAMSTPSRRKDASRASADSGSAMLRGQLSDVTGGFTRVPPALDEEDDEFSDDEDDDPLSPPAALVRRAVSVDSRSAHTSMDNPATLRALTSLQGPNGELTFATPSYAPTFRTSTERKSYAFQQLLPYLKATAGPYRVNVSCSGRLHVDAVTKLARALQQPTAPNTAAVASGSAPHTSTDSALVAPLPTSAPFAPSALMEELSVQAAFSGELLPQIPYPDELLAVLPLRSLSVPDQRYASVHPGAPLPARQPFSNPQDEPSCGLAFIPSQGPSVHVCDDNLVPGIVARSEDAMRSMDARIDDAISIPAWLHSTWASPPLPEDIAEYSRDIVTAASGLQYKSDAGRATRAVQPSPFLGARRASASGLASPLDIAVVGTVQERRASTAANSAPRASDDADGSVGSAPTGLTGLVKPGASLLGRASFSGAPERASRVSFSLEPAADGRRGSSFVVVDPMRIATSEVVERAAMSPAAHLAVVRRQWRRAGRIARKLFLRHGMWDPLLATDATPAGGAAPGTASTAFFYAAQRGAAADDPTLLSSDDEAATASLVSPGSGKQAPAAALRQSVTAQATALPSTRAVAQEGAVTSLTTRDVAEAAAAALRDARQSISGEDDMLRMDGGDVSGDAPVLIGPASQQDTRIRPSALAARFSSAAQAAIQASDGTWLANKLAAWASSAGVSLPALTPGTDRNSSAGFASVVGFTIADRFDIAQRRRGGRAGRTHMRLRAAAGSMAGEALDEYLFANDTEGGAVLGDRDAVRGVAAKRAPDGRAAPPGGAMRRVGGPADNGARAGQVGSVTASIADGSYVGDAFAAEQAIERLLSAARSGPSSSVNPAQGTVGNSNPALNVNIIPQYSSNTAGKPALTTDDAVLSQVTRPARGRDDRDFMNPDALVSLRRRIAALRIPPLPPDMGTLLKQVDVPVAIVAHAVRVAMRAAAHDSFSSVASGMGGGSSEALRSVPVPLDVSVSLDEAPRPLQDEGGVHLALTVPAQEATAVSSTPRQPALVSEYDIVRASSTGSVAVTDAPGTAVLAVSSGPTAVEYPLPLTDDIVRPTDVGDASGYVGSGRISFMGVERGWRDAIGIGPPTGAPITAAIGVSGDAMQPEGPTERQRTEVRGGALEGTRLGILGDLGITALASTFSASTTYGTDGARPTGAASRVPGAGLDPGSADATWGSRPRGLLLTTCAEHSAAVNALAVCQDHTFFASASDDGTVKVWGAKNLDREAVPASIITYAGHLQECRYGDAARGIRPGRIRVTDVTVCDNSCSIASGSSAGSVHVLRIDIAGAKLAARGGGASSVAPAVAYPEYIGAAGVRDEPGLRSSHAHTHGSFLRTTSSTGGHRRSSGVDTASDPGRGDWDGDQAEFAPPSIARTSVKPCDGALLLRRLVFDASEGGVVAVRHYQTNCESVLAIALQHGGLHGCDLRSRSEAWARALPAAFGTITCMEVCPGSSAIVVGTDRGVIAVFDTRFNTLTTAWRHSARCPITALYPYVTIDVRASGRSFAAADAPILGSGGAEPQLGIARQLCAGVGTGEGEIAFWNLETGVCTRLLRSLPSHVHPSDAYRLPFLSRVHITAGRISVADMLTLASTHAQGSSALAKAAHDVLGYVPSPSAVRSILCPVGTPRVPTARAQDAAAADARVGAEMGDDGDKPDAPSANGSAFGQAFILGGVRGAGASRRRQNPFALGYATQAVSAGSADASARGAAAAPAQGSGSRVLYTYGGTSHEGLPVWMLTAGTDRVVRCWDLDRPRASHTVCGFAAGTVRDAYDGAWLRPPVEQARQDEHAPVDFEDSASESDPEEDDAAMLDGVQEGDEVTAAMVLRRPRHFRNHFSNDEMSSTVRSALDNPRCRKAHPYKHQRGVPVRTIFSQQTFDPSKDTDVLGPSGVPPSPTLQLKGPVPAPTAHESMITCTAWLDLPLRFLLTGATDGVIRVWR